MILDNGYNEPKAMAACKPDPEEMLQNVRKRKAHFERAKELIFEIDDLPVEVARYHDNRNHFLETLGNIETNIHALEKEIENWLKEIDKSE